MKKLYHHTKGKIHPSPPPPPTTTTDHHLSLLPIAIATLAATLPPHDQHVLAYLLSISTTTTGKPTTKPSCEDHAPQFNCNCFRCYTTFWVRWDSSPNRKVIHEIIDAYEDKLIHNKKNSKSKKERKNNNNNKCLSLSSSSSSSAAAAATSSSSGLHAPLVAGGDTDTTQGPLKMEQSKMDGGDEGSSEKGSVRKIVNFIGERIWGVWGV